MKKAHHDKKSLVVSLLTKSFNANQSVNYIIKQDAKRINRISALMDYSFEVCYLFGEVFLSDDEKGCALLMYPDKKKTTLKSILLDVKLIVSAVGFKNIKKTLSRESTITKIQPKELKYYLWFIGVDPEYQNEGVGSVLLNEIIVDSENKKRPIYLEYKALLFGSKEQLFQIGQFVVQRCDLKLRLFV